VIGEELFSKEIERGKRIIGRKGVGRKTSPQNLGE